MSWQKLSRSERTRIGVYECDVWPTGEGARYSVIDTATNQYVKGGKCASVAWAKDVVTGFVSSLSELKSKPWVCDYPNCQEPRCESLGTPKRHLPFIPCAKDCVPK